MKRTVWPVSGAEGATVKEAVGFWLGGGGGGSPAPPSSTASTQKAFPATAPCWLTRTPRLPPFVVVVRLTATFCQALLSVTAGELTSATVAPALVRSRSLSWIGLPTDEATAAFTHASAS